MATTRRMNALNQDTMAGLQSKMNTKRQPEQKVSQPPKKKRAVFGDITNRENAKKDVQKKGMVKKPGTKKTTQKSKDIVIFPKAKSSQKSEQTNVPTSSRDGSQSDKSEDMSWEVIELSQEASSSQESAISSQSSSCSDTGMHDVSTSRSIEESPDAQLSSHEESWEDIDAENIGDIHQVALYAHDIFLYYKERELKFPVSDYINEGQQPDLTPHMRAILVDWLVEVQENFELNHETLYLAVKLVDHYLSRQKISREKLQLVGATALFVACKFDERCPPVVDDFLYICDDAYKRDELLATERHLVRTVGFDIGFPLSYRFLRRYAKCARAEVKTLTLARYILESSLLDYTYVKELDSRLAAACLLLAMRMASAGSWSGTLVHYTGYQASDLCDLVRRLNTMVAAPPSKHLNTIRTKYSHKVFHEVAKTAALSEESLEWLIASCNKPTATSSQC